jgi:hypothetical protein
MRSMEPRPLLFGLPDAKRRLIGRLLMGGMVVLMAGGIAVGFGPFFWASRQLPGHCASLAVGTSPTDVQAQAESRGYEVEAAADGRMWIEAPRMAGPQASPSACEVGFGPNGLLSAKYVESP